MKKIIFITIFLIGSTLSYVYTLLIIQNYYDPLGLEPDQNENNTKDLLADDIIASSPLDFLKASNVQIYELGKLQNQSNNKMKEHLMPKGYLEFDQLNQINKLKKRPRRNIVHFRFAQKTGQDEEYYNKVHGKNDINKPGIDDETIRKGGLSNGVVTIDKKRICNFETSKYPEFYNELRKD